MKDTYYFHLIFLFCVAVVNQSCNSRAYTKDDIIGIHEKICEPSNFVERVTFTQDSFYRTQTSDIYCAEWKGVWVLKNSMVVMTYQQPLAEGGFEDAPYAFEIVDGALSSMDETMFVNLKGASESEVVDYIECVDGMFRKEN